MVTHCELQLVHLAFSLFLSFSTFASRYDSHVAAQISIIMENQEKGEEELKELLEEYTSLIELDQHDRVSKVGSRIRATLVELLDEDFSAEEADEESGVESNFPIIQVIRSICESISIQDKIAAAYSEVREFVRLRVSI